MSFVESPVKRSSTLIIDTCTWVSYKDWHHSGRDQPKKHRFLAEGAIPLYPRPMQLIVHGEEFAMDLGTYTAGK
jgi:hypothetical protein